MINKILHNTASYIASCLASYMAKQSVNYASLVLCCAGFNFSNKKYYVQQKAHTTALLFSVFLLLGLSFSNISSANIVGADISNTAVSNFNFDGSSFNLNSNTVDETIVIKPTDADIDFYQFANGISPDLTIPVPTFNGPDPVTNSGFSYPQLDLLNQIDGATYPTTSIDPQNSSVGLISGENFRLGDPVFIVLNDADRNVNDLATLSIVQDTVTVIVSNESGDSITLTLSEIEEGGEFNSGRFAGFIPTWNTTLLGPVPAEFNSFLPLGPGEQIQIAYTDTFNLSGGAISRTDLAASDRAVRVFNSISGELLDGAEVLLLHGPESSPTPVLCSEVFAANGQAMNLFDPAVCPSATASFPALIADTNGEVKLPYTDFTNPDGYLIQVSETSVRPGASVIESRPELLASGFTTNTLLSFERAFLGNTFLPLSFDLPKDSLDSDIVLQKSTNTQKAGIGEYVQYTVSVANQDIIFPIIGLSITDQLPKGFRYIEGTARADGIQITEPTISGDGQTLTFNLEDLDAGKTTNIQYITEITSGTKIGPAINTAVANDSFGNTSNKAQVQVSVIDDLLRTKNFIVGRVFHTTCEQKADYSIQMKQKKVGDQVFYEAYVEGGDAKLSNVTVRFELPKGMSFAENTTEPDDIPLTNEGRTVIFKLGNKSGFWEQTLGFSADVLPGNSQEFNVKAELSFFNQDFQAQSTDTSLALNRKAGTSKVISYQFKTRFESFDTKFPKLNEEELKIVEDFLSNKQIETIEIQGHSDSQRINSVSQYIFQNNEALSQARAQTVAEHLTEKFPEVESKIKLTGKGAAQPIATNATEQGRETNRRVELVVDTWEVMDSSQLELPLAFSEAERINFNETVSESSDIALGVNQEGLEGIRVLLEDGSYVITDKEGKYHFSGIEPGAHVIQVDEASLPEDTELFYCQANTRFAGVPYSQFVDAQAGSLWRSDFYVRKKAIETIKTTAVLKAVAIGREASNASGVNTVRIKLEVIGNHKNSKKRRASFILPDNYKYLSYTAKLDNRSIQDPSNKNNVLRFDNLSNNKQNFTLSILVQEILDDNLSENLEEKNNDSTGEATSPESIQGVYSFMHGDSRERISGLETNIPKQQKTSTSEKVTIPYLNNFTKAESLVPAKPKQQDLKLNDLNAEWLNDESDGLEVILPVANFVPANPSASFAVKHLPKQKVQLEINNEVVSGFNYDGIVYNKNRTLAVSKWRGVNLDPGENLAKFRIYDQNDTLIRTLDRRISYIEKIERLEVIERYSYLVADGVNKPRIAVRMSDQKGHSVRQGLQGRFSVSAPYQAYLESEELQANPLGGFNSDPYYTIADEGIAIIELQPTTQSGSLSLDLQITGRTRRIETWLEPAPRDWILVGIAEGTVAYNEIKNSATSIPDDEVDGYSDEGRLAFYAKGRIRGDWLLTAAYDSERDDELARIQDFIDPSMYFTLYGDATRVSQDAPTSEELFLRIERKQFYALFGDFETGLSQTELGRYSRTLTGIKSEFKGKYFSYNAFATEEDSNFVKDEIQGDGTSGLYRLSQSNILINSEKITIETRDRFRSEVIKDSQTLRRFLDYEVDYIDGTLLFKEPIFSRDSELDPIVIVVDYETNAPVTGEISAGGRAALQSAEQDLELGITILNDNNNNLESQLAAVDARITFNEHFELNIESASSETSPELGDAIKGKAFIAELTQQSERVESSVYLRENENNFGIGQQNNSEGGTSKVGGQVRAKVSKKTEVNAEAYQQENLDSETTRQVAEAKAIYRQNRYSLETGLRSAVDENEQSKQESQLFLLGASTKVFSNKLGLRINTESALEDADNIDNPNRYVVGADYQINSRSTLYSEHEVTDGGEKDTQTTRVGLRTVPWKNAKINTSLEDNFSENSERTFANFGLLQTLPVTERWSIDFGFDASETINDNEASFDENVIPVSGERISNDYQAISMGSNYRANNWAIANRLESRQADDRDRLGLLMGWQRQLIDGIAYSAKLQAFDTKLKNNSEEFAGEASASVAYRPISSPWIILDRLEYQLNKQQSQGSETLPVADIRTSKWINNLKSNYLFNRRNQVSFNHGIKYVKDNIDGFSLSGVTQFVGLEYRYDINGTWDVGMQTSGLVSQASNNHLYSYGANVGWNAIQNLWMSLGYNVKGFTDGDFDAADYTVQGPWLKLRFKYDQNTFQ